MKFNSQQRDLKCKNIGGQVGAFFLEEFAHILLFRGFAYGGDDGIDILLNAYAL